MKMLALLAACTLLAAPALAQTQAGAKPTPRAPHPTKVTGPVKTVTGKEAKVKLKHAEREAPSKSRPKH